MPQSVHPSPPDAPLPAVEALIEGLRSHYPDMGGFTIVSMTGRGRDFLHHLVHTRIGGLLPTVQAFDDYRTGRIAEATGRTPVPEEEALLRFHALRRGQSAVPQPPADSQRLLSFLAAIAEFSVTIGELRSLERIGPEQLARLDDLFGTMEAFRSRLATEGLFYPPIEATRLADLSPGEGELFVGLPLMTPADQRFFGRIPRDRLFVDAPLFGPHMPAEPPGYETALALIRRIGIAERRGGGTRLDFSELAERAALPTLLASEIDAFLRGPRDDSDQLFIVPLDERLSFYLWELLFRSLGGQVNFVPWLPFTHFAPAHRLREALRDGSGFAVVRRELVAELTSRWNELDEADRSAFEGAITLCDELDRLRPLMGDEGPALAEYLITAKKLRLRGRRSAPIQVVGLGEATGIPYHRAVILPMTSGVFPQRPFSGPYLNWIHMPRIHRAVYEADDLALRQFLCFGQSAHIVALYDQPRGEAPSPHFAFLAAEFDRKAVKRLMAPTPLRAPAGSIAIDNTDGLKEKLRGYDWSFSSLKLFFTCPFRFIIEKVDGVKPPPCFEGEEHANLLIGDFLHRLFADLTTRTPALERWQEEFDDRWESDADLCGKLPDRAVRKAIVQSHLADIAAWEGESRRPLLFSDEVTATEIELAAPFGNGRYRLKGRIDRLQRCGEKILITDLKYREKEHVSGKTRLADLVEKPDSFDERFQLLIYAYLVLHHERATPENLEAAYLYLRPRVRGDYEGRLAHEDVAACNATMERIADRLDKMLGLERFAPNPRAEGCPFCPHKALCLRPDLYRTGGQPW
jgi:hypothetical protein